ncbi:serine hydrolase [candidate division KSB1 bacterium]|nr:serine hydrolase [candidate division KSB1 bacterium]
MKRCAFTFTGVTKIKTHMMYCLWATALILSFFGIHGAAAADISTTAHKTMKIRFQVLLDSLQEEYSFPGMTAAYILSDGKTVSAATGLADIESGVEMTADSRMLAASIGKSFVAATVLALVQENRVNLDDPISTWLDNRSWFDRLPNHDSIILRQLLNHTSGLANHVELDAFARDLSERWQQLQNPFTPEQLVAYILERPALFAAGEGWAYSDTGYILAGMIIESVTGHRYEEELRRRFLEHLELTLTEPSNRRQLPGLVPGYVSPDNIFALPVKTTASDAVMAWHPGIEWTGGGLISNSRDLVKWAKALFEGDAMTGNTLDELLRPVTVSEERPGLFYGLGVTIAKTGTLGPVYGHKGWIPGYVSSMCYYAQDKIAVAFQINTDIGMLGTSNVIKAIENRLAVAVIQINSNQLNF